MDKYFKASISSNFFLIWIAAVFFAGGFSEGSMKITFLPMLNKYSDNIWHNCPPPIIPIIDNLPAKSSSLKDRIFAASKAEFSAPDWPIATVATGTPFGIWTIDNKESKPFKFEDFIGTPITGSSESEATIPGRCAAPPAPAIIILIPFSFAFLAKLNIASGVLCAEIIFVSWGILSSLSTSEDNLMVSKSLLLPIITETKGFLDLLFNFNS